MSLVSTEVQQAILKKFQINGVPFDPILGDIVGAWCLMVDNKDTGGVISGGTSENTSMQQCIIAIQDLTNWYNYIDDCKLDHEYPIHIKTIKESINCDLYEYRLIYMYKILERYLIF